MSGLDLKQRVQRHRREILQLARQYGVKRVRVTGSVARGEHGPDSDVDLIVQMEEGRTLLDRGGFLMDVQELLGCEVDVLNETALTGDARAELLADAREL